MIKITCEDNMELMKRYPDNYFELAIVDPPYGINNSTIAGKQSGTHYGKAAAKKSNYDIKYWDSSIPNGKYFKELFRVSKNQIIWGANYMTIYLPPSMGWVVWNKDNGTTNFSDCEIAFSSFDKALRMYTFTWNGMIQGDMKNKETRIHPTQKPVALYKWILNNYAQEGDNILDTHLGSGSIAIACHDMKFDLTACELDEDYYNAAIHRLEEHQKQISMF